MAHYAVSGSDGRSYQDKQPRWYAFGYPTGRTSSCVESKRTTDKAQAEDWARRRSAGEAVPEAGWSVYADD